MALTQIYPLFKNYFIVLLPCHFPYVRSRFFPSSQGMSRCTLGATHWSFKNFFAVMFHQTVGAVNKACGATFLLWLLLPADSRPISSCCNCTCLRMNLSSSKNIRKYKININKWGKITLQIVSPTRGNQC